nr:RNA-dependent RNA polymerase [Galphimia cryptic virus]
MESYDFTDFSGELENLNVRHPHQVRRESNITYKDEFALNELLTLQEEIYKQYLEGWSRSYYSLDYHMKGIMQYGLPNIPNSAVDNAIYTKAIQAVRTELSSLHPVRAYDIMSELDIIPFKSSSAAGYDYVGAKGEIGGTNHTRAMSRARAIVGSVADGGIQALEHTIRTAVPDVGYTRTQLSNLYITAKVRGVWGRAFHYILIEGSSAYPLIQAFMNRDTFYHIGQDPTTSVPQLLSRVARISRWIYALDWKQFDATVSRFEIHAAFDLLKEKLIFPNYQTEVAFEISRQLFIHKKIAAPDGNTYWAHKGIPSGSYFTSIIGSFVNRLRIGYLWEKLLNHQPTICFTQGDDSLIGDEELIHPTDIGELANTIGWYFNPEKTEYARNPERVTFLGRSYRGGLNIRDLKRCLRLLIYPEYPVNSGRISAYRALSIAEDSGGLSDLLNSIARRLRRHYGVASEEEVPDYFKRYIMGL